MKMQQHASERLATSIPGAAAWFAAIAILAVSTPSPAAEILRLDFEQGQNAAAYDGLDFGKMEAAVVAGGPDGTGHCLRIHTPTPATSCPLKLTGHIEVRKNLLLSFDYRAEIEEGFEGTYLGMSFFVAGEQWFWTSDEFSGEWRHAEVEIGRLKSSDGRQMRPR